MSNAPIGFTLGDAIDAAAAADAAHNAELLTPQQAAQMLGVARCTLAAWRQRGTGPAYRKLGYRTVRYPIDDLDDFVEARRVVPKRGGSD